LIEPKRAVGSPGCARSLRRHRATVHASGHGLAWGSAQGPAEHPDV